MAHSFDIVVVGGGPAGLAAACMAAEAGRRVALVESTPWLGGQIWRGEQAHPVASEAQQWLARFRRSGATLMERTTVIAAPAAGVLQAEHPDGPRTIHWRQLILATGARELFLPFPGWTLPGVMGPAGLLALVKNGYPVERRRVAVVGSGPLLLAAAAGLREHGARIAVIAEQAPWKRLAGFGAGLLGHPRKLLQGARLKLRLAEVPHRGGVWPVNAVGGDGVERVTLTDGARVWTEDCDLLACGFGLVPNVELPVALGCALAGGFVRVDSWQASSVAGVFCAGELTGISGAEGALVEGQIAGLAAVGQQGRAEKLFRRRDAWGRFGVRLAAAFALRPELGCLADDDTVFCRCEDVTLGRVRGQDGWRSAKLQTRCGMGPCQGRVCGAAAHVVLGWGMDSVRPPLFPVRVACLRVSEPDPVEQDRNQRMDPQSCL
ncbi:MAG TPA: FAD/NAD(P)-binding oxidoreductase [Verrucomicrobiota bacterium]|nr:FAD/NAD(P)-binding oxidoreductase [Verrucomicrobiota bacterium]HNU50614.1 FAD/NAD(P)-binding oxidoreductase [Verrucomicrobiota bacterium]